MKSLIMRLVVVGAVGLTACDGGDDPVQEGLETTPAIDGPATTTPGATTPGAGPGESPVGPGAQGTIGPGTGQDTTAVGPATTP